MVMVLAPEWRKCVFNTGSRHSGWSVCIVPHDTILIPRVKNGAAFREASKSTPRWLREMLFVCVADLRSRCASELTLKRHDFGIQGRTSVPPKWPSASANQSDSFNCKWLLSMEATIFEAPKLLTYFRVG